MRVVVRLVTAVAVAAAVMGAGVALAMVSGTTFKSAVRAEKLPDIELRPLAQRSVILAADGSVIGNLYDEDREPVKLRQVPKSLVDAVIAVEDAAFFDHDGVSLRGFLRAVRTNARKGGVAQGGSTITQQLVKNVLLTADRTVDRKVREAVLAVRMEDEYSKHQILEHYLNTVYFGQGAHGVQAAAERFFGKDVSQLDLAESALLAGTISSPTGFDPITNPEAAQARRSHVLRRMVTERLITGAEASAADAVPLPSTVHLRAAQPDDYFAEEVRRQLLDDIRLGSTPQDRFTTVFRRGIRVHTTLDPRLQVAAENAVRSQLPESPFTAAVVAVEPGTGAVRALVGGKGFEQSKFNLATQGGRQAGSSFKTIALAAWLEAGHSPEDMVDATAPCEFPMPPPEEPWRVDNYDGGSGETLITTLREATIKSSNCGYARLSLALGPDRLASLAQRMGVSRKLCDHCPSIVLGTGEVTPLEMATVYATLAAEGVRTAPVFVTRVEDAEGNLLLQNRPEPERVLEPQVARSVTDVLQGVVDRGTGRRAGIGRPVAGKTGTAQEWRDAWFAGYTPQLATAVWMGHPAGQESMKGVGGLNVTGGSFPAQIWSAFMREAVAPLPAAPFTPPDVMAWPQSTWVGPPPSNLPPNILALLPPHLLPPPPAPLSGPVAPAPAPLSQPVPTAQPQSPSTQQGATSGTTSTTTTQPRERPPKKRD